MVRLLLDRGAQIETRTKVGASSLNGQARGGSSAHKRLTGMLGLVIQLAMLPAASWSSLQQ
jgi:hypothetical protein